MCGCGDHFQRAFPAKLVLKVYFDRDRRAAPLDHLTDANEFNICLCCGQFEAQLTPSELEELRRDAELPEVRR